jgi:hypothetical protein
MEFMRFRVFLVACLFGLVPNSFGQLKLSEGPSFSAKTAEFRVDPLGYPIWFAKDAVYKMDTTGNLMFQQSVKAFGDITDMDLINPMKYLVFFREQQSIGFFDNTFTPYQQKTSLTDLGISYATLVCYSMQFDRFWVYDQDNSTLVLFNSDGKRSREIENLNGLIGLQEPVQMLERFGNLYVVDENRGVYIFDMFGALINFIDVPNIKWIDVDANNFFYIDQAQLCGYNFRTKSKFCTPISGIPSPKFQFVKQRFYVLFKDVLKVLTME